MAHDLNIERQRFHNSWVCNWHRINIEGQHTDVEDFRGGRIRLGGVLFEGQPQQIFWEALSRYLTSKVHEVFANWNRETAGYPREKRIRSLELVEGQLLSFASQIIQKASDTDRRLRGRGFPNNVSKYDGSKESSAVRVVIRNTASAHREMISERASLPRTQSILHDVFISHASEDKASFVRPLAEELERRQMVTWFDEAKLEWGGPSLRPQIEEGLLTSHCAVVVLSHAFFAKEWPQAELDALLSMEFAGRGKLLPIWHGLSHTEMTSISPIMSSRLARESSKRSINELADEIADVVSKLRASSSS